MATRNATQPARPNRHVARIKVRCRSCAEVILAGRGACGKTVKCPACEEPLQIPSTVELQRTRQGTRRPASISAWNRTFSFSGVAIAAPVCTVALSLLLACKHLALGSPIIGAFWLFILMLGAVTGFNHCLGSVLRIRGTEIDVNQGSIRPYKTLAAADVAGIKRRGKGLQLVCRDGSKIRVALAYMSTAEREIAVEMLSQMTGRRAQHV